MTNQFDKRPTPSKFDGVDANTIQREKDQYGRLYCDKLCPAYNEEFCDAILDYYSNNDRMCKLPLNYQLIEVKK